MSGDSYNIRANSWYRNNGASPASPVSPISSILSVLAGGISAASGGKATAATLLSNNTLDPAVGNFLSNQTPISTRPKAFLNWVLFDEQFKYVSGGFDQVGNDQEFKTHTQTNLSITRNGYLYVYVSNETPNIDVFFDNVQVTHTRGPLTEETHYYPFGGTLSAISSKAAGKLENKYKFGDKELQSGEFSDGSGLELYDFGARFYDQQLGMTHTIDPKSELGRRWSPFVYAFDNPVRFVDPDGMWAFDANGNASTNDAGEIAAFMEQLQDGKKQDKPEPKKENKDKKDDKKEKSSTLSKATKIIQATVIALAADDATGVGVIDDVAIPILEVVNGALWAYDFLSRGMTVPESPEPIASVTPSYTPTFVRNNSIGAGDFSQQPPGGLTKLRNGQGWRDAEGNVWKKDQLHKDHWDVTNPKTGKKVKEIDFGGNQIWPNGPKNKNK